MEEAARVAVRHAVTAEMAHRGWNIQQLHEASGLDKSTLGDFLDGSRWPRIKTLGALEKAVEWPAGTIVRMLDGGEAPPVGGPAHDADSGEEDALLYRRPEGLSDQEWEQIKQESRGFIEWQINRAAQER